MFCVFDGGANDINPLNLTINTNVRFCIAFFVKMCYTVDCIKYLEVFHVENTQAKKPIYKNLVFWLVLVLGLAVIGLGLAMILGGNGDGRGPAQNNEQDPAELYSLNIEATDFLTSGGDGEFLIPEAGYTFVGARFEIENTSDVELALSPAQLFYAYVDEQRVQLSPQAMLVLQDDGESLDAPLAPGESLSGWFAMEVPLDWNVVEFRVLPQWAGADDTSFSFENLEAPSVPTTTEDGPEATAEPEISTEADPEVTTEPEEDATEQEDE